MKAPCDGDLQVAEMTGRKGLLVKNAHGSVQWVQRRSEVRQVPALHFRNILIC